MRRLNKKGLSGIVTTLLLVMLIIIAIGAVWITVNNLIEKSSEGVSFDVLTIDLEIVSAKINFSDGKATIRVRRNVGEGEVVGIKFLVEDTLGSDVFERKFESFQELEERTFILDLTESEFLLLTDINKISIAAIYKSATGVKELIGIISDSVEGLNDKIDNPRDDQGPEVDYCTDDEGCPADSPVIGSEVCNLDNTQVFHSLYTWDCLMEVGICLDGDPISQVKTYCTPEQHCFEGVCIPNDVTCTQETIEIDCGIDGLVGELECSLINIEEVIQDYKTFRCINNLCESSTTKQVIENCSIENPDYQCINGECFEVPECTADLDCLPAEFCNDIGVCELEVPLNTGNVLSIWPFGLGEYFDSPDLPTSTQNGNYGNNFIIFPQSQEDRCLALSEHVYPENGTSNNAYVRISESRTNVTNGIYYEIWQRDYICTQTSYYL